MASKPTQHKERLPDDVWSGPLASVMAKSYTNGVIAGGVATGFAFGVDKFLTTPVGAPRWPGYAAVMPQHRGYGWILFCLATFQYFVEDTEVSTMSEKNHELYLQQVEEEREYIANLELQRKKAAATPQQTHTIKPPSNNTV